MFLTKKYITLPILVGSIFLITGCSNKEYNYSSYPYSKTTNQGYKSSPDQEIKNSPAMHRATMKPYKVFGKWYYPTVAKVGDVQTGIASWYGPDFHSKKTSNGETYNMYAQTAAHKTLPMNTMVRVDNLENGKSTIVRINDRGPFVDGRIIDLSNKAAHDIDMVKKGIAKVRVTILGFHAKIAQTQSEKNEVATVGQYFVQVGAFSRYEGALETQRKFKLIIDDGKHDVIIKRSDLNRVWVSGFRSVQEAEDFKNSNGLCGAMIIAE